MDDAIEKISKGVLDILWSQWSTLGAYLTTEQTTTIVVDPEAALVGTCSIGRADPRLFDEVLDWLTVNHGLVKTTRVKRFINDDTKETARTVAAVADYISSVVERKVLDSIVEQERDRIAHGSAGEVDSLFWENAVDTKGRRNKRELDPKFLEWGFERSRIEARRLSGTPDLKNPANIMLLMRSHYGRSARADILTYLLTGKPANSYQIALMIGYNQSTVYRELAAMSAGGLVKQEGRGKSTQFWVDRDKLARSLWHTESTAIPVFFNWAGIYRAFADALATLKELVKTKLGDVLKVEAYIDLSERIVPILRGAGEPLKNVAAPDPSKLKRLGGEAEILAFIEKSLGVIQDSIKLAPP
ncbi:MAG: helix-turn-helix domain-containing protein [Actinobacteria bacterium]|nr:helix-turn-helix domain-containing protein [Actinomycetota bacterium]MCG2817745.1 helix-turn-helix domain-containing protein [Actinomycetes bacterium]MBU4217900.1 helix-turn-helix domain-containing protein [Actinomycetota bacterium]MBU4360014.1 helix-turn-helix domain-containing protein [Actinomycetota bacterium]MBU4390961.1 helix-turn-helix domain-containing protein [Actinomycetota bacterium]